MATKKIIIQVLLKEKVLAEYQCNNQNFESKQKEFYEKYDSQLKSGAIIRIKTR